MFLVKQDCWFYHCGTIKHVQSPHWLPEDQWSCKSSIVGFVTVRQSNLYSHLTDYQTTSGPTKATLMVLSLWDNQTWDNYVQSSHWLPEDQLSCKNNIVGFITVIQSNMYSHLTDYQRTSGPVKATLMVLHSVTNKHVQSLHWLPEDQWSCKNNIVGFVTVRPLTMYSHLTDNQRTSGPVKATLLVLSLWYNQTCTVNSLITRGPFVLLKQHCWFCHWETIKHVQSTHWLPEDQWSCLSNLLVLSLWEKSNIYSHFTDYQRTSGPVKATLYVLSLWDNKTCTVTSLITRGPVVL